MKDEFCIGIFLGIILGVLIGACLGFTPHTVYNNTELITQQSKVLDNCMVGWSSTLEVLRESNRLIK